MWCYLKKEKQNSLAGIDVYKKHIISHICPLYNFSKPLLLKGPEFPDWHAVIGLKRNTS